MPSLPSKKILSEITPAVDSSGQERIGGVTARVVLFSLFLAALFGYCIPIVAFQMSKTFLGAMLIDGRQDRTGNTLLPF